MTLFFCLIITQDCIQMVSLRSIFIIFTFLELDVKDTDKNFEKEFISSLDDYLYENDSSKLINQIVTLL